MSTTDTEIDAALETAFARLAERRRDLADLLDTLTPEEWESPSLCEGWRVRDVAAHLAMNTEPVGPRVIVGGLIRARGDVWAMVRDISITHAESREPAQLVEELRSGAESRAIPALTNVHNFVLDVLVHTEDIARPLGRHTEPPVAATVAALRRTWAHSWPFRAAKRMPDVRLVARDAELVLGAGRVVEGQVIDLLLLATGRTASARPRLRGPGLADLDRL